MSPKVSGQDVQLFVIQPVYKTGSKVIVDPSGKRIKNEFGENLKIEDKKFLREAYLKVWFSKVSLNPYGEYIGTKGEVVKNRSMIFCKDTQSYYTVAHSIKELQSVLQPHNKIGF